MQTSLLDIIGHPSDKLPGVDIDLTFKHFIDYLNSRVAEEDSVKKNFYAYVLKKFRAKPALAGPIAAQDVLGYKDELTLLYSLLMPAIGKEKDEFWALAVPLTSTVFYGTDAFYNLLKDNVTGELKCEVLNTVNYENHRQQKKQLIYSFILNKLYHFPLPFKNEIIHTIQDEIAGTSRYYCVNIDRRFIEVYPKGDLPEINLESLQQQNVQGHFDWEELYRLLPLTLLKFEGFAVITITDITSTQALENIKSIILNRSDNDGQEYYQQVIQSLQTLAETTDVEFDLLPALRINDKLIFNDESSRQSLMVRCYGDDGDGEQVLMSMSEQYLKNPTIFFYRNISDQDVSRAPVLKRIREQGIISYAMVPVYFNNHIAGIVEAYSRKKNVLTETVLARMEAATPLLAQLLQKSIDGFDARIQSVIKERFTSLQPAVQWKFNEVAWHYLRDSGDRQQKPVVENILFRDVYPLYAAIDIRNSTIERNAALKADLCIQLNNVIDTIAAIKKVENIAIADGLIYKSRKWLRIINERPIDEDHTQINDFLDNEVTDFFNHFKQSGGDLSLIVDEYFRSVDERTGSAFANRRNLETSLQTINSSVNQYLDLFKGTVQESYPCYFEKFRTDGIEFDMYIGQSISPSKPFNILYLKNLRLWQLSALAAIAKITHSILPDLSKPLQTTQLIFIHSNSIDISFRNDERRFDVEGGYNIRYQVIKKRIDKVTIKRSAERLTQPGKIALVYFNKKEADEYVEYINYLQEKGLLLPGIEFLDLEELQGVSGLKALRVDVAVD